MDTEKLAKSISDASVKFTAEHFDTPGREEFLIVQNAMLEGARIALKMDLEEVKKRDNI